MDKWADAEHRKFKPKKQEPRGPQVVIRAADVSKSTSETEDK